MKLKDLPSNESNFSDYAAFQEKSIVELAAEKSMKDYEALQQQEKVELENFINQQFETSIKKLNTEIRHSRLR